MKQLTVKHRARINEETYVTLVGHDLTLKNLLDMKCPNFVAAKRLVKALKKLHIDSVSQLYKVDPYSLYNMRGVGVSQVFVAECLIWEFYRKNPYNWYKKFIANPKKKRNHEV